MSLKVNQLRAKHKTFTYQSFSWELVNDQDLKLSFVYKISPDIIFDPSVTIHNVSQEMINKLGEKSLNNYVFHIGLAEIFSYWKTTASPEIIISAGKLPLEAMHFWHKLLSKGMGEFFYQNNIEFNQPDFVKFVSVGNNESNLNASSISDNDSVIGNGNGAKKTEKPITNRVLIPVGGGKDSAISLELLKNHFDVGSFIVSTPDSAQNIINANHLPSNNQIKISRVLDPKIFELNEKGYLNGHVPISAYLAFLSIFTADLFNYTHVAISNERSSNEGNVWYCDQEINHQYSKSYEFESDLQTYSQAFLPKKAPFYFSFLRPLYELQIAQIFAQYNHYHSVFRSCNRGQKQNAWCRNCSKCLFAWSVLLPFIGEEKLETYFGGNIFKNEQLWSVAQELLGLKKTKPFDCVGTHEETIIAFHLCIKYYQKNNQKLPVLLEKIYLELKTNQQLQTGPSGESNIELRTQQLMKSWDEQNSLPNKFKIILRNELKKSEEYATNS